jgi:hypothetical protein
MYSLLPKHPELRPRVTAEVSGAALRDALGPVGAPATLTFARALVIVTTPGGSHGVAGRVAVMGGGAVTAGLRPQDADRLRSATRPDRGMIQLVATGRTVTVGGDNVAPVTVGCW